MKIAELWGEIGLKDVGYSSGLTRAEQRFRQTDSRISSVGRSLARNLKYALVGASAAIGAGLVGAVSKAKDFDQTIRTMGAVAQIAGQDLKDLRALALEMGADTVFSANEAAEAMLELGKGGLSPTQIQAGALANTLDLAAAGNLALADAASIASNAMNTFGLSGKESKEVADALAGAANASSADVSDLALALSQGGSSAEMAGLSIQETAAALAALADMGIKGSDAGTSLKTMLMNLQPTTVKQKALMRDLNLSFVDAEGNFDNLETIAGKLADRLGGLTQAQRVAALEIIFGSDAQRAANALYKAGADGMAKYIDQTSKVGNAHRVGQARMKGFSGAWEAFKGSIETLAVSVGSTLLPVLTKFLNQAIIPLTNWLSTKLGPLFSSIAGWFDSANPSIERAGDAVNWLKGVWQDVAAFAAKVWPDIRDTIKDVVEIIRILWEDWGDDLMRLAKATWEFLKRTIGNAIEGIRNVVKLVLSLLKGDWGDAWDAIKGILGAAWDQILGTFRFAWERTKAVFGMIASSVQRIWGNLWRDVKNLTADVVGGMLGFLTDRFADFVAFWLDVGGAIVDGAALAFGWIPGVGGKIRRFKEGFHDMADGIVEDLREQADEFYAWGETASGSLGRTSRAARGVANAIGGIVGALKGLAGAAVPSLPFTAPSGPMGGFGAAAGGGTPSGMAAAAFAAVPGANSITSGYRPWDTDSYHSTPPPFNAVDIAGDNLTAMYGWLKGTFGAGIREMILDHSIFQRGSEAYYEPSDHTGSNRHLHLADRGGTIRGPALIRQGPIVETHIPHNRYGQQMLVDALTEALSRAGGSSGPMIHAPIDVRGNVVGTVPDEFVDELQRKLEARWRLRRGPKAGYLSRTS